jgi:hypothetical protein
MRTMMRMRRYKKRIEVRYYQRKILNLMKKRKKKRRR